VRVAPRAPEGILGDCNRLGRFANKSCLYVRGNTFHQGAEEIKDHDGSHRGFRSFQIRTIGKPSEPSGCSVTHTAVTALDASAAMLERARHNVGDARVHWVLADVFGWEPVGRYDVVFFAFWLSHVPIARFDEFWRLVARCLRPEGRVFFLDEGRHDHWQEEHIDSAVPLVRRRLRDGSEHNVVKVLWDAKELEDKLTGVGWKVAVQSAGPFYWGRGSPGPSE
jgi:SAM-dependent methyltransferase